MYVIRILLFFHSFVVSIELLLLVIIITCIFSSHISFAQIPILFSHFYFRVRFHFIQKLIWRVCFISFNAECSIGRKMLCWRTICNEIKGKWVEKEWKAYWMGQIFNHCSNQRMPDFQKREKYNFLNGIQLVQYSNSIFVHNLISIQSLVLLDVKH